MVVIIFIIIASMSFMSIKHVKQITLPIIKWVVLTLTRLVS